MAMRIHYITLNKINQLLSETGAVFQIVEETDGTTFFYTLRPNSTVFLPENMKFEVTEEFEKWLNEKLGDYWDDFRWAGKICIYGTVIFIKSIYDKVEEN